MKVKDFLELYRLDSMVQTIAERLKTDKPYRLQLKGLSGSLDAVLSSAVYTLNYGHQLFVMHDKEEAAYFYTDLKNLLGEEKEILLFPTSYKRPYSFDDTENANILMRAEVLNRLNQKTGKGELIVTYPEALTEKVINKKSLVENTLGAKIGEKLDTAFLSEMLAEYGFERTEFVYEAGQYAVRGGIVDVYSYANDLPYRIELFGDEIESIRTFDPDTQLSVETKRAISIIPNVQTKLLQETREAFLDFLPDNTTLWFKDVRQTLDVIEEYFEKASHNFEKMMASSGGTQIVSDPEQLFQTQKQFKQLLEGFNVVEIGKRFHYRSAEVIQLQAKPQPSFNKDFQRLVKDLHEQQGAGFVNLIATDSPRQINRLTMIFDELDHDVRFQHLPISLREGFIDQTLKITCYTDHQLFDRFYQHKAKEGHSKTKAMTLKELRSLQPGDYVTHVDYGIGRFAGLEKVEVGGRLQEAIRLVYRDDDLLYVNIHALHKISKYSGKEGGPPSMSKLGSPEWENKKKKVKSKVKDIAHELISLYAKRKAAPGYAYSKDGFLQAELESSFIYEDTPDQAKSTEDVKADMEQPHPMDRLVCGDVGFGKTEIAIRAAFKAACDGKQVAVLVPTTILAMQHYRTFRDRLEQFPVTVDYVNRFKTAKDTKETLKRLAEGKIDILIGTHRIVSKDVKFKDLGLMIIDEEQKFGVKTKEKLKEMKINVDTLTLTATPIPRTLHFSLMGARDLSVIATPPPNRQPVKTELHVFDEALIRDAIVYEMKRGGQVFFVHNRIKDIEEIAAMILRHVPDCKVTYAHGQMEPEKLEKRMMKFVNGEYDVLVSTNIIESGLDIENANTIIINRAHMFGLSDLHQMRGRVGRSNKKAFCYLLTPPVAGLPSDARKRLSTLEEFSDLGEGFKIAMRDLDIRGAGNLLGGEQTGFITDLGFEMYHQVLDDAIKELKETEFRELFLGDNLEQFVEPVRECTIETDMEVLIPDWYVSNISERLNLYSKLDSTKDLEELEKLRDSIVDRFGPLPEAVQQLVEIVKLRWQAQQLGFEKLTIKKEVMKGYLPSENNDKYFQSDTFGNILKYVQQHPRRSRLKESKHKLIVIVEDIQSLADAKEVFEGFGIAINVTI
ncbi:transcription-repair coupling factor (superfamily II helicase) [Pontibacter ummariensis]|uniref:Transcription-repair-coupling factor n=1 Tax=Pontibacter ummariensis TaxID=1610492 RepID=A0A239II81_9BACT|nr:transcription-repair coupling factor [Pontibacter ummariensis]PRY09864.1 transcription-repair coupling factor (superfamily II helicase) [Pontibacter ummariensis]SNS93360.1 transcription-repair coupling factor [Pontibacter ummariensis]